MGAIRYGALEIEIVPGMISMENSKPLLGGSPNIFLNTSGNSSHADTCFFLASIVAQSS